MFGSTVLEPRSSLSFSLLGLLQVELKFFSLEDVSIYATGLSRAGRNAGHYVPRIELFSEFGLKLAVLSNTLQLSLDVTGSLSVSTSGIRLILSLSVELHIVFLKVPVSEWCGIDEYDSVLDKSFGTNKLVVSRVIDSVHNTSLARYSFRSPREVSMIRLKSSFLYVTATSSYEDDSLSSDFGIAGHSSHFELSLFLVNWHASTSGSPLVPGVPRNTHNFLINNNTIVLI